MHMVFINLKRHTRKSLGRFKEDAWSLEVYIWHALVIKDILRWNQNLRENSGRRLETLPRQDRVAPEMNS